MSIEASSPRRRLLLATGALSVGALTGCALWRPPVVPLRTIAVASPAPNADTLLVFLPGSYSRPEEFLENDFVGALHRHHVAADVLLVDAHLAYYSERTILDRLQLDVVEPARSRGYRSIWFVGISVGAFGALLYFASGRTLGPGVDSGIVLIAPYLGDRRISTSIDASGGLMAWPAPTHPLPPNAEDVQVWAWLQKLARNRSNDGFPALRLAYGASDRFAYSDDLLAAALPAPHVTRLPGGHDWPTWRALWQEVLAGAPFPLSTR